MSKIGNITRGALLVGLCMALTPAVFTVGPLIESRFFPVTVGTEITNTQASEDGVAFHVRFRKVRQCEFLGLAWYAGALRMPVDFEPDVPSVPRPPATRPRGYQQAGPWEIRGLRSLDGTQARALHRCHPLWITITKFYGA